MAKLASNAGLRTMYVVLGWVLFVVGFIGYIVPGLPGTVFLILSLCCFKRGSARFEAWLLNNRLFGSILRDWEATGSISLPVKVISTAVMWLCIGLSMLAISKVTVKSLVIFLAIWGTWYIWSRPTKRNTAELAPETLA